MPLITSEENQEMDETTKVIIATLSGFIIAFFAEPVKNYFQNRAKLHNLRVALYKEMIHNYSSLDDASIDNANSSIKDFLARRVIRIECYKHAIENEVSLFYQLDESNKINWLQGSLMGGIIDVSNYLPEVGFRDLSEIFKDIIAESFYVGNLDAKLLRGLASKKLYREIMKKGKELSEARNSQPQS